MRALFNFLSGLYMFYLLYLFLEWYVKGHFGKRFIWFWAFTIFSIFAYKNAQYQMERKMKEDFDPRSAQEIWEEQVNHKYDPSKGY